MTSAADMTRTIRTKKVSISKFVHIVDQATPTWVPGLALFICFIPVLCMAFSAGPGFTTEWTNLWAAISCVTTAPWLGLLGIGVYRGIDRLVRFLISSWELACT